MDVIVAALTEQHAELAGLLEGLDEADWQRPAPSCEGWTVADVVLHLAQTDELAIGSAQESFEDGLTDLFRARGTDDGSTTTATSTTSAVDDAAEVMVAAERGASDAELFDRWKVGSEELRGLLAECDPSARKQWVSGDLSARTLATTRLAESWIHTGDVAEALGIELAPPDRLWHVARLAWRTIPYAFARSGRDAPGPVAFELRAPNGDTWEFIPDAPPVTVIRGDAVDLCRVAARRVEPADTGLHGEGPDVDAVLELVRTYA